MNWDFKMDVITKSNMESAWEVATKVGEARCPNDLRKIRQSPDGEEVGFDERAVLAEATTRAIRLPLGRSLIAWVLFRQPVGGFLTALLMNDFVNSHGRADLSNKAAISDYATWLYNDCPSLAWGTKEKIEEWPGLCSIWSKARLREFDEVADAIR